MERIVINHCPTCDPIMDLLKVLIDKKGCEIIEKKCRDPHFNEMYFKVKSSNKLDFKNIAINNITRHSETKFLCECHWSTVEIKMP